MKAFIDFIEKNYSDHAHKSITIKILELLDYIDTHYEEVLAEHAKENLFRHPKNHLAVHIGQYATSKDLALYLTHLLAEVKGCFTQLIEQHKTAPMLFSYFLSNINDSKTGCMEARLRNALEFAALIFSTGVLPLDALMQNFKKELTV